ncbi:DNA-directed RNA polymerase I subunit A49 isoform 1 [Galdieria sulphuraria]|uniref:DNA-directed RNA polymerase I subunit A49 isoform 1 n=1 Tax=Galdieria sulphuraria TaxID=130081 RepID=M2XFG3_GALSU|nr:DNA-directed RNA polymerase I subunit A49 isoform 1 [Galdieria sulphuraria]EME28747.1 DNA-directed RNA polymerase I subunit A49 isoform 1 [Galdieria sulphuraria]|eukprot:XP_005705267.1 DNA-directed RNA polymerase I subunit A49 isoform 1 [Galdieria sulphuraria]
MRIQYCVDPQTSYPTAIASVEGFRWSQHENSDFQLKEDGRGSLVLADNNSGYSMPVSVKEAVSQHCFARYFIGVKKRGENTIYCIEPQQIVHLYPAIRQTQRDYSETSQLSKGELKTQLIAKFGSKATKKRRDAVLRNAVNELEVDKEEFKAVESSISQVRTSSSLEDALHSIALPPMNKETTVLSEAYPLQAIILPREWKEMESSVGILDSLMDMDALKKNDMVDMWGVPEPLANDFFMRQGSKGQQELICCLFLKYLCKFHTFPKTLKQKQVASWAEDSGIPNVLLERFLADFAEYDTKRRTYFRSPLYMDKLIYSALVVWLHLVGFSGDPQHIAELLGMTVLRCLLYFRQLGCKVQQMKKGANTKSYQASLQVPLQFPEPKKARQLQPR